MNIFPAAEHHHAPRYQLAVTSPAASEPLTSSELQTYCQIDILTDPAKVALLQRFGAAGRQQIEARCKGLVMVSTTYTMSVDRWPHDNRLTLPRRPVTAVASVQYTDASGANQTLATSNWKLDAKDPYSQVRFIGNLPTLATDTPNAIRVTFTAGYANAASVPDDLKLAIGAWCKTNYDQRESVIVGKTIARMPFAYECILESYTAPEV